MTVMKRRPEATLYLGEELYRALEEYRQSFSIPPSASAVVREAVRRFLEEAREGEGTLSPRAWVEATEPLMAQLIARGVSLDTGEIIRAIDKADEERTRVIPGSER